MFLFFSYLPLSFNSYKRHVTQKVLLEGITRNLCFTDTDTYHFLVRQTTTYTVSLFNRFSRTSSWEIDIVEINTFYIKKICRQTCRFTQKEPTIDFIQAISQNFRIIFLNDTKQLLHKFIQIFTGNFFLFGFLNLTTKILVGSYESNSFSNHSSQFLDKVTSIHNNTEM